MNTNLIASDLSYLVLQKRLAEREGREVPTVKAPTERPAYPPYPAVLREMREYVSETGGPK